MDRESEYLLHLLGAFLHQAQPEEPGDLDWGKLLQLSKIHTVTGILGYMAMSWPICPDGELKSVLRKACLTTINAFNRRAALGEKLVEQLNSAGIDHIVMKGYVLREYYPVPELRTYGDIDLVIRPEDRQRCNDLMLSLGYRLDHDWEPVYSYLRQDEFYEIHTQIMEIDVSDKAHHRSYFGAAWDYAQPESGRSYRFTPEFHFLYMITHIAKHVVGSGAGIRMYLDVAAFIRHFSADPDWQYIRQELEKLHLADFANAVLTLTQRFFGVESPLHLKPIEEAAWNTFLEFTLSGGIFGQAGRDSGTNSLKSQNRDTQKISRLGTFAKRLFPSAKTIQSRYTYLQDKPWLLPAAWVHRLIKTRDTWQQHAREAQNIMSADLSEVQRIKNLYEQLGL